jgi:hypothetical protein
MQDGSRSTDNPVEPENVAQDSATRGRPEGDAPRSGKGVLRSVAGGITLVGAVFFMFHLRCATMLLALLSRFSLRSNTDTSSEIISFSAALLQKKQGGKLCDGHTISFGKISSEQRKGQEHGQRERPWCVSRGPAEGLTRRMEHTVCLQRLNRIWMNFVDPPVKLKSVPCLLSCTERHNHMI